MSGGGFLSALGAADIGANFNGDSTQQWGFDELTKSASANTKSAWYLLGTVKTDCLSILLRCGYLNNSGTDHLVLHDIGIGPSGSQTVVINNIVQGQPAGTALTNFVLFSHVIPLAFPAGTQIWIRSSVDVASSTPHVGGAFTPMGATFQQMQEFCGVETIGQSGSAAGTVLAGGAGTKGSYVSLGTATKDYSAVFFCYDFAAQSGTIRGLIDLAIGAGGSQKDIVPNILAGPGDGFSYMDMEPIPVQIPAGTQLWGRFCNLDGSTNSIGLTAYGVF